MKKNVLVVDIDFQCNASRTLGFAFADGEPTIYEALTGATKSLPLYEFRKGFDYIPSSPEMEFVSNLLMTRLKREELLHRILSVCEDDYDYMIIDCPANGGLMNTNAMCAADFIIVPTECEMYSLQGLSRLESQVNEVREMLNQDLVLLGYLRTRFDRRLKMHRDVSARLESADPHKMIPVIIHNCTDLTKVSSSCPTVFDYNPSSRGSEDYAALARYVEKNAVVGE